MDPHPIFLNLSLVSSLKKEEACESLLCENVQIFRRGRTLDDLLDWENV